MCEIFLLNILHLLLVCVTNKYAHKIYKYIAISDTNFAFGFIQTENKFDRFSCTDLEQN